MTRVALSRLMILDAAKSSDGLMRLLADGLEWPMPEDLDTVPLLDWRPEELHLDPAQIGKLTSIKQIPRLKSDQPFGVFLLNFEGGRLPQGAVRRVVNRLIRHHKVVAKGSQKGLWDLSDLIFFCQTRDGGGAVHVVAFSESGPRPVMRVISWDTHATESRVRLLAESTLPDLLWPDRAVSADEWRRTWSQAFQTTYREGVRNAADLAVSMASVARSVRDTVRDMLPAETEDGPIRSIYNDVKRALISDLDYDGFADMYAQTMVYGLLTARITHPEIFIVDAKSTILDFENPFLDAIYSRMRGEAHESFDVDELGLQDLADLLAKSDLNEVLADFGAAARRDDPVVHFYEDFLKEYDPAQQIELGVYYTPQPVVSYQIQTIDRILKQDFGLPLGVADPTTWADYCKARSIPVPPGVDAASPFVFMLDPATGTGTYLVEWLRQAERNVKEHAAASGLRGRAVDKAWEVAVRERILGQMSAFEISLASYTVAHLKVALELPEAVRNSARIPVYLTDTLAAPHGIGQLAMEPDPMSEEAALADVIKLSPKVTVVVGNPPYRERARGHGGVVEASSASLSKPSLDAFREPGLGRLEFNLHNLNVYFWRWALWKAVDQSPASGGIVSFITTSPYMSSAAFSGMRRYLRARASGLLLVDCTPEGHQPPVATRLFPGVQQPLAIMTAFSEPQAVSRVFSVTQLAGSRDAKFEMLSRPELIGYEPINGQGTDPLTRSSSNWSKLPLVTDVMPFATTGLTSNRSWVVAPTPLVLQRRWRALLEAPASRVDSLMKATRDRDSTRNFRPIPGFPQRKALSSGEPKRADVVQFAFRSFDRQYLLADSRVIDFPRPPLWNSLSDEQVFVAEHHSEPLRQGPGLMFTSLLPASSYVKGSGGGRILPMWRDSARTQPNLATGLLEKWGECCGSAKSPEDWLAYLAGCTGTSAYFELFRHDLEAPGIRVPITKTEVLAQRAITLGEAVLWAHTLGNRGRNPQSLGFTEPVEYPKIVRRPDLTETSMPDGFTYDASSTTLHFGSGSVSGVSSTVIDYTTSGMPVLRKWFAYRKPDPSGKSSGALSDINATHWYDEWTDELLEILTSLTWLTILEPEAATMLEEIIAGPVLSMDDL